MNYLKYCKKIIFSLSILCLIFVLIVFLQIGIPISGESLWINEIYTIKTKISKSIETPKLVIVSGSNSLFGISCKMIYEETQTPCVNGGTHAGLGINYILHRAPSLVKSGDTVLLPLEYNHYKSDNSPRNILVSYVIEQDPKYLLSTDLLHSIRILSGISFSQISKGLKYKLTPPKTIKTHYKSKNINDFGDETSNLKSKITENEVNMINALKPDENIAGYIKSSEGLQIIKKFIDWCNDNNIKVIATWPNTVWFDAYKEQDQQDFFKSVQDFYQDLKVPVLGKAEDSMYDKSMFYDTRYHMNDVGVRKHTQHLIDLLEPYLEKMKK